MITFRPLLLVLSVFFVAFVTFLSSALAIRHTVKLTPVEAVNYMETAAGEFYSGKSVQRMGQYSFQLWQMAWRNVVRFKKRFVVSALCLTLGLVVSLGVAMIFKGSDKVNQIEYDYNDVMVETQVTAWEYDDVAMDSSRKNEDGIVPLIPDELVEKILSFSDIQQSEIIQGGFGEVLIEEKALQIFLDRIREYWLYRCPFVMQIMSDEYLQSLKLLSEEQELYLDVDSVINGEGMIMMHEHQLSPSEYEMSREMIGMKFGVYDIVNKKKTRDMRFGGYLDFKQEGLPGSKHTIRFDNNVYFLISEKGFANIRAKRQTFGVFLDAKPGCRSVLEEEVRRLVDSYNAPIMLAVEKAQDYWMKDEWLTLTFFSKQDVFTEMQDYIVSNRLLMGALCGILLLMGIVNYINVTITDLIVRRKEFAVMESIGLTSRQLRKMLIWEGIIYSLIITVLTAVFGSMVFWLIGKYMQERMGYFAVSYPIAEFAVCACLLFVSCSLIVLYLYRKYGEGSVALRLRIYAD